MGQVQWGRRTRRLGEQSGSSFDGLAVNLDLIREQALDFGRDFNVALLGCSITNCAVREPLATCAKHATQRLNCT
jgi:hypothetical protein